MSVCIFVCLYTAYKMYSWQQFKNWEKFRGINNLLQIIWGKGDFTIIKVAKAHLCTILMHFLTLYVGMIAFYQIQIQCPIHLLNLIRSTFQHLHIT